MVQIPKIGVTFWISWIHSTCAREYFEQAGIPQGPTEAEEMDPFQATRDAMTLGKHVEVFFCSPVCWRRTAGKVMENKFMNTEV